MHNINEVLADPSASNWLKSTLKAALERDPSDAARDAELLSKLLCRHADNRLHELLGEAKDIPMSNIDPAKEAIQYALKTDEGIKFLRCWNEGNFKAIHREWPDAPESIFIGADSLHPITVI